MASLLQVGDREIVCLDNELTLSSFSSAKHSLSHVSVSFFSQCMCASNRLVAVASQATNLNARGQQQIMH